MWSRPVFFALYFLGAEVFALKLGPAETDEPPKPLDAGGSTGSHEIGFVMGPDPVVVRDGQRPC